MNRGERTTARVADYLSIVELEKRHRSRPHTCSAPFSDDPAAGAVRYDRREARHFVPRWIDELMPRYNAVGP
jgi:hypothetical protein